MFRELGKLFHELWSAVLVLILIVASLRGDLSGTWMETAMSWASLLILAWLVLFAIGVSRGEPNP